jgi:membrane protease YdiL (CAAX protease family)
MTVADVKVQADGYATRPCYGELGAIFLVGLVHILVEVGFSDLAARAYNAGVSVAFLVYVVWRIRRTSGVLRIWGLRRDNFFSAVRAQLWFVAVAVLALVAFAVVSKLPALAGTFWLTIALYPVWGVAQQFALQNLIAKNLAGILSKPLGLAVGSATLFAISHYPRFELVALTFVAGIFLTLIYRKFPNLWAVGIVHGLLGSLAFYVVLTEDPGAAILAI